jgi:CRP-like cAMP-binding protein
MVSERWVEAGSFLAREGERGSELFVLVDGTLESVKQLPGGERILHVAQRGDAIGEFAVLANIPRSASIRALTDATVIVLPAETFQNWLRHYPDLALRVIQQLVRKIVASNPNQ